MLPVNTRNILQSYRKDRKLRIKYNEYVTSDYDIMVGVPQGSILGATLPYFYCRKSLWTQTLNLYRDHNRKA